MVGSNVPCSVKNKSWYSEAVMALGAACCRVFAQRGWRVAVVELDGNAAVSVAGEIGPVYGLVILKCISCSRGGRSYRDCCVALGACSPPVFACGATRTVIINTTKSLAVI
jgi:hypothetical protein